MITQTNNFSGSSDSPENPPEEMFPAEPSTTAERLDGKATGGAFQKSPFPYFGGKSIIAAEVWAAFGSAANYVEPFAGSLAVLLNRPAPHSGPETVNDLDCHVVNAWRAIQSAPGELAGMLVGPVSEVDTEARHNSLVRNADRVRAALADPDWYCIKYAAWWIKGANEWIGGGWGSGDGPWSWTQETGWIKRGNAGKGINRQLPQVGNAGRGIKRQLPHVGDAGNGINRKLPHVGNAGMGQYAQRVEWIAGWLTALRDRLSKVRIACGDWRRVLGDSSTHNHGMTAIFLDPPYAGTEAVYGSKITISHEVRAWCLENGNHPSLRIILCGRGIEHDELIQHGWTAHVWSAKAGYSRNCDERHTETLWLSPNCITTPPAQGDLFSNI